MRASALLLFAGALVFAAAGCGSVPDYSKVAPPAAAAEVDPQGRIEQRRELDEQTGRVIREWKVVVAPGRGAIRHGMERVWHPNGALHTEREFRYGKPIGTWRSWYESGQLRTECFYFGPDAERTMSSWREDGKLSARGPASDGVKRGKWSFWWKNGRLAEEGEYRGGVRQGSWVAWSEDGERRFEFIYDRNVRVSERELPRAEAVEAALPVTEPDPQVGPQ